MAPRRSGTSVEDQAAAAANAALEQASFDDMVGGAPTDAPEEEQGAEGTTGLVLLEGSAVPARIYTDQPLFQQDETAMIRLRLAQGLSQEVQDGLAHPGDWLVSGHDPLKAVTVVPLLFNRNRAMRDAERMVVCQSPDAVRGYGTPGGECASCPMARWTPRPSDPDRNDPPKCSLVFSYAVYSVEHDALLEANFSRTSEAVGKLLNNYIATQGLGRFAVRLTSRQENRGTQRYSIPVVQLIRADVSTLELARSLVSGQES